MKRGYGTETGGHGDTLTRGNRDAMTLNHAPNHVGFGIGPELCVVQDRVQGKPCTMLGTGRANLWFSVGGVSGQ